MELGIVLLFTLPIIVVSSLLLLFVKAVDKRTEQELNNYKKFGQDMVEHIIKNRIGDQK